MFALMTARAEAGDTFQKLYGNCISCRYKKGV